MSNHDIAKSVNQMSQSSNPYVRHFAETLAANTLAEDAERSGHWHLVDVAAMDSLCGAPVFAEHISYAATIPARNQCRLCWDLKTAKTPENGA